MALQSINGKLVPTAKWLTANNLTEAKLTDQFSGHYLNVSYRHTLNKSTVFSKDRINVEGNGSFVFLAPDAKDIEDKEISLEVKAPDGETLQTLVSSINTFFPIEKPKATKDTSKPFVIEIDPKSVNAISKTKVLPNQLRLRGKVIDINGKAKVSGLHVVIWAIKKATDATEFNTQEFKPVYAGKTDKDGYFFGSYPVDKYAKAFGVVNGNTKQATEILFTDQKDFTVFESPIILAIDFESAEIETDDCSCDTPTPELPDEHALVESSGSFSQDLGGGCVNFTTPNRTLEEYSFYHVVRTTEPEIKGLTLTRKEARSIKKHLLDTHGRFTYKVTRLMQSLNTVEIKSNAEIERMVINNANMGLNMDAPTGTSRQPVMMPMMSSNVPLMETISYANLSGDIAGLNPGMSNTRIPTGALKPDARPSMIADLLKDIRKKRLENASKELTKIKTEIEKFESGVGATISISEIYQYRELYTRLKDSIETFENLLDDAYMMYTSFNKLLFISNAYFVKNYASIKSSFQDYLKDIGFRIAEIERIYALNHPGRRSVTVENPIDWDDEPTIYQNTTIAHGHLLHFKQQWKAAGYSMGDLLYSLPLAPCQKKQIAIFDWDRSESAGRTEAQTNEERLTAHLSRDRDVTEVMNSAFNENIKANSHSKTKSKSGSLGISASIPIYSALVGVSGGYSASSGSASSNASQDSSRNLSASTMNNLRDNVQQSASSVRSQRSTVIQTVTQGETFNVTTEVIANHNHCHSMTMEYFEVLRHLVVEQKIVEVSECLFVPLQMSMFTTEKVLRWKNNLRSFLVDRRLLRGFDALERIHNGYKNSDLKDLNGMYAEETIDNFTGNLRISFEFERPYIAEVENQVHVTLEDVKTTYLLRYGWLSTALIERIHKRLVITSWTEEEKDKLFEDDFAPDIAREFIDTLTVEAHSGTGDKYPLNLDISMVSRYKKRVGLYITLNPSTSTPRNIRRKDITHILLKSNYEVKDMSRIMLTSFRLNYETDHLSEFLVNNRNVNNDIINKDVALFYTPLNKNEKVNPKHEDQLLANNLLEHLNEFLEFYHKQLWLRMDSNRLFGLLDGFIAPNTNGKSVASVCENKIIGITGNNIIVKVAPGYNIDPTMKVKDGVSLLDHYLPLTPPDPFRVSLPTRGIYAEAVMGQCNSCEKIDESRHWRFSEVPCGDEPTLIQPINTDSRRADPGNLQTKAMESPVVNIQNAPAAPDPTGLKAALDLMGKSGIFNDMTGLSANQANALAALQSAAKSTSDVIQVSKDLVKLAALQDANRKSKTELDEVDRLEAEGKITKEDAQKQRNEILGRKDKILKGDTGKEIIENPAIQERIKDGDTLTYASEEGSIILEGDKTEDAKDNTLLKFMVNVRRPKRFMRTNADESSRLVNYAGHFGFDWLRDEYIFPIENVAKDLSGNALNANTPLCTDVAKLKTEYLTDVLNPIKPYGKDYFPAWLSIFPPRGIPGFGKGSRMHEKGVMLSLEIDEIDTLDSRKNTIEFRSTDNTLSIEPSSIKLKDIVKNRTSTTKVLDAVNGVSRTFWTVEDAITIKSKKALLTSHTEIKIFAKGSDGEKEVGKLMVYKNDVIPKAELVMVRTAYEDVNINLGVQYHDILKNQSFNQALIRAEVIEDEKFIIDNLDATDADVIAFKTNFPKGGNHNGGDFLDAILKLYQKFGTHNPPVGSKRSILFITNETANSGGVTQDFGYAAGKFVWGNAVAVFNTNLASTSSFAHEIGHSLSLPHTFDNDPNDAGIKHRFFRGHTDNYMDYTTRAGGVVANPNPRLFFFKWQWDVMRSDQSLTV